MGLSRHKDLLLGTLHFVRHFLRYFSVISVYSSSSSLAQDRVHLRLWYWSPMVTWHSIPITFSPFSIFFHHFYYFSSFYYFNSDFWYIDMHTTLAGLYPFLLGSLLGALSCHILCLYIYIGSPARSWLSRCCSCPNTCLLCVTCWVFNSVFRHLIK